MAETSGEPAIRARGLGMVYKYGLFARAKVGLKNLDLDVPKGSIYGYLGQNGAGKTTTIKILVGLQFSTSGEAWMFGEDVRQSSARRKIGFMPENPYFYEYLNAEETLDFYGQLSGMERAERKKRIAETITQFGLDHARGVRMRNYSKGMRQRLGLAQAVLHNPPLVILDEPMSGLDPLGRRDIRNAILALRDQGTTVFFSSHILGDVQDICDRVCVLSQGEKIAEGPLHTLLTGEILAVQLSFSGFSAADVEALKPQCTRVWHDGTLLHLLVKNEDDAQKIKAQLEARRGVLRAMQPHAESLEEYFVRITAGTHAHDGDSFAARGPAA